MTNDENEFFTYLVLNDEEGCEELLEALGMLTGEQDSEDNPWDDGRLGQDERFVAVAREQDFGY